MNKKTIDVLKNKLTNLSQALAAKQSSEKEIFIYDDTNLEKVFKDYDEIKTNIKSILEDTSFLTDRHKISAFFLSAILKNNPIKVKENLTDIDKQELEFVINTNLGLLFANFIIKTFYKQKYSKELKFIMPESSCPKPYLDQLIGLIKIFKDRIELGAENINVLLLAISHILFLLEKYSEKRMNNDK